LQDEAARIFPAAEETAQRGPGWLALLRPRLAFALSVVAAMIVLGVAVWPPLSGAKTKGKQLFADSGERELMERRSEQQVEALLDRVVPAQAASPSLADSARIPSADPARSSSRGAEFGEARQLAEARGGASKNSPAPAPREDNLVPGKTVPADKTKEVALAKDEVKLLKRDAAENEGKLAAEQSGLKPADRARPVVAQSSTAGRAIDSLGLNNAGATTVARNKQPAPTAKISPAGTVDDKAALLAYQKSQPATLTPAVESYRSQTANTFALNNATTAQNNQQFVQVPRYRRNFNSPPMPQVLASFQFEQNGRQLRIVDADGSVYEGEIGSPAGGLQEVREADGQSALAFKKTVPTQTSTGRDQILPAGGVAAIDPDSVFRVTGTNRTLNQLVIFTGNLGITSNTAPAANSTDQQRGATQLFRQATPASQVASNTAQQPVPRVQGQATIGSDRIEINAVPAGP